MCSPPSEFSSSMTDGDDAIFGAWAAYVEARDDRNLDASALQVLCQKAADKMLVLYWVPGGIAYLDEMMDAYGLREDVPFQQACARARAEFEALVPGTAVPMHNASDESMDTHSVSAPPAAKDRFAQMTEAALEYRARVYQDAPDEILEPLRLALAIKMAELVVNGEDEALVLRSLDYCSLGDDEALLACYKQKLNVKQLQLEETVFNTLRDYEGAEAEQSHVYCEVAAQAILKAALAMGDTSMNEGSSVHCWMEFASLDNAKKTALTTAYNTALVVHNAANSRVDPKGNQHGGLVNPNSQEPDLPE